MKELIRDRDLVKIGFYESILNAAGIKTFIRNENLHTLEASIPTFFPALCIIDDSEQERAIGLLNKYLIEANAQSKKEDLICQQCGETNPATFETCWSCQSPLQSLI